MVSLRNDHGYLSLAVPQSSGQLHSYDSIMKLILLYQVVSINLILIAYLHSLKFLELLFLDPVVSEFYNSLSVKGM